MNNELLLLSGNDIPFPEAQITIHQPTLHEIAYIGEECFYTGCEFLRFSKDRLDNEDKIHLENYTNFDVLMSIMKEQNVTILKNKTCVLMVLSLIFPLYNIDIKELDNKIYIEVTGSGFMRYMVRNIVGLLVACGSGKKLVSDVPIILAKKDRVFAAKTAPACGLYLKDVKY